MSRTKRKILIYHVASIGDTIVALPAFYALKKFYNNNLVLFNLSIANNLLHTDLYNNCDLFSEKIFLLPPQNKFQKIVLYFRFLWECIRGNYSVLYCFSPEVPKVLSVFFRLFQSKDIRHCFLLPEMGNIPLHKAYVICLEKYGINVSKAPFQFPLSLSEMKTAEILFDSIVGDTKLPLVAFGVGGNQSASRWSIENFSALLNELNKKYCFIPIFLGSELERNLVKPLIRENRGVFLADTSCQTLRLTAALLKKCSCYIGNDTGVMHIAASVGIPTLVIMSSHNMPSQKWYPLGKNNLVLRGKIPCEGCELRSCPKGDPAPCMEILTVDYVLSNLHEWIRENVNDL